MRRREDAGWLDIIIDDHGEFSIQDRGRLSRLVRELKDPEKQHPMLYFFIGQNIKDEALNALFSNNNIKRTRSNATVNLRSEIGKEALEVPIFLADGNLVTDIKPQLISSCKQGHIYPIVRSKFTESQILPLLYARLLFLFCDIVCIFADDFPGLNYIADFLIFAARVGSASTLPVQVRPVVLVILHSSTPQVNDFNRNISANRGRMSGAFSDVRVVSLDKICETDHASTPARYCRLKSILQHQADHITNMRSAHRASFKALHLKFLFQAALKHTAATVTDPFDHIRAMRTGNELAPGLSNHLAAYLELGFQAGIRIEDLTPSIASAMIADNYPPRAHLSDPNLVFERLYRTPLIQALQLLVKRPDTLSLGHKKVCELVRDKMNRLFSSLEREECSSIELHKLQVMSQSGLLCQVKSNRTCLWCQSRRPQHRPSCGHSLCDTCVLRFGQAASDVEYRFTLQLCIFCLSRVPLVVDLVPPTKRVSILAIDGGGVRGVIPLEFLLLLQEKLGACPVTDLCDLIMGTSSGGIIGLPLAILLWDVRSCSEAFDRLARRVFQETRQVSLACFHHSIIGRVLEWLLRHSFLGRLLKWLTWWLCDGLYDAAILESVLKENLGGSRRIFDAAGPDSNGALISRTKVGVVATNISQETSTFVFGNFNGAEVYDEQCGYELVRPEHENDPFLWQAARATSAAPLYGVPGKHLYFSPTFTNSSSSVFPPYTDVIGTFQDGGLKENNPAWIARQVSRHIWPAKRAPALLVSIGTGAEVNCARGQVAPYFRNVFKDGFARRALNAWLSSLDGERKWRDLVNQLDDDAKRDHIRLNVPLKGMAAAIDNVNDINGYRDLVLLQPGAVRMVAEAASALLISTFYLELDTLPESDNGPLHCRGTIRCRPPIRSILPPLSLLHGSQKMCFVTDSEFLGHFLGEKDICSCCDRYAKKISFEVRHLDEEIMIYMELDRQERRKISGFPDTVNSFIKEQGLLSPFGNSHHDSPGTQRCTACDNHKRKPCQLEGSRPRKMRRLI
ncbi:hypothetical protein EMCG_07087 [[Emmonsia] crescens]|uniref:PNPLA domain-containing protein n=1 Tax=[Emmonsia] crescens TaxID=73230 RepID=A0A0G2JBC1_9EURO|nr:hypothetical protein EMCG_07087 [Emmonsia crescens UAMH 3008]